MNIFKNKHWAMAVSATVLFVFFIHTPLQAGRARRGSTVVVTMTDGRLVQGELLAVKTDALLVYDQDANLGKSIDLGQVVKVKVRRESKFLLGMIFGLGVGMGITTYTVKKDDTQDDGLGSMLLTPLTGLCAGILAAIASKDKKFSLDRESSQAMQKNLKQLKRYARERDFEKPAAN